MVSLKVFNSIVKELRRIEERHEVRVLYACESGSRAWGFPSRDSDYDVRFIYVHQRDWYLSIDDRRDVIEEPISEDLDLSGWELRKALRLLRRSNPALLEWLRSPVVYALDERFYRGFRALARTYASPRRCYRHYLSMAVGNDRKYLRGDTVRLKKYLYVLRPLLACRWLERGLGEVPMLFDELVERVVTEADVRDAVTALLVLKKAGLESEPAARIPALDRFIAAEFARLQTSVLPEEHAPNDDNLNQFFQRYCLEEPVPA